MNRVPTFSPTLASVLDFSTIDFKHSVAHAIARTPRIAKLMALAIRFEGLIADGTVADYSELAQVSRARITQIKYLNLLAPDIQEVCFLFVSTVSEERYFS